MFGLTIALSFKPFRLLLYNVERAFVLYKLLTEFLWQSQKPQVLDLQGIYACISKAFVTKNYVEMLSVEL